MLRGGGAANAKNKAKVVKAKQVSLKHPAGIRAAEIFLLIGAFCALIRSVSILRVFQKTRNLVRMIIEIVREMWAFMVVLFISVFGFATLMIIAMKVDASYLPDKVAGKNAKG